MFRACAFYLLAIAFAFLTGTSTAQPKKESTEAPPQVLFAMPLAIELGKTSKLTVRGLRLDTVTEIHLQEPRSTGKIVGKGKKIAVPNGMNANQVGDSEIEIEVTLPKEVAGSVVPFTLLNAGGESKPHELLVGDLSTVIIEKEPNDSFKQAQPIVVPCVVEGTIRQPQDVDVFRFEGKRGEHLVFDLQANRFGSPLDGSLTLYDEKGHSIASADDSAGSLDPILEITLLHDGIYFLSLIDANDQGAPIYLYRLNVRRR